MFGRFFCILIHWDYDRLCKTENVYANDGRSNMFMFEQKNLYFVACISIYICLHTISFYVNWLEWIRWKSTIRVSISLSSIINDIGRIFSSRFFPFHHFIFHMKECKIETYKKYKNNRYYEQVNFKRVKIEKEIKILKNSAKLA